MVSKRNTRRTFLRTGLAAAVVGLAGCSELTGGGSDVQDTDGDGVIDSEDYAPRDSAVQRESQVVLKSELTSTGDRDTATPAPRGTATRASGDTPAPTVAGTTWEFADGPEGWQFGLRIDSNATKGRGTWREKYDGSLRLHVDGGPETIVTWTEVGALSEGTTITVDYAPERFAYEAATLALSVKVPGGERLVLDRDKDSEAGGREQDGTLRATVPRDLPAGTELEIKLNIWPGETTVWIRSVTVA